MKIEEAIILAGGLGTRLRSAVPDLPKCMAPIAGRPFLAYLIDHFRKEGIRRFIFSLGYKHEAIQSFITQSYPGLLSVYSIETEPLGTGGAIKLACEHVQESPVLVLNGDTFFNADVCRLATLQQEKKAECVVALKAMTNAGRYGLVELNADSSINAFKEKEGGSAGMINGGIYLLDTTAFLGHSLPDKFSFEKEYLEAQVQAGSRRLYGSVQEGYFIDIGIPADFEQAQTELLKNI